MKRFNKEGIEFKIVDDNNIVNYVDDSIKIKKRKGVFISIIPLNFDGISVSLTGFKYPLNHKYIEFSSTLGVSNEVLEDFGIIKIHKGEALVFESLD